MRQGHVGQGIQNVSKMGRGSSQIFLYLHFLVSKIHGTEFGHVVSTSQVLDGRGHLHWPVPLFQSLALVPQPQVTAGSTTEVQVGEGAAGGKLSFSHPSLPCGASGWVARSGGSGGMASSFCPEPEWAGPGNLRILSASSASSITCVTKALLSPPGLRDAELFSSLVLLPHPPTALCPVLSHLSSIYRKRQIPGLTQAQVSTATASQEPPTS